MTGEVIGLQTPPPRSGSNDDGNNGNDLHGRVSAREAHMRYLATKEDIQEVKKMIAEREASLQRWLIGILLASLGTVVVALIKLYS